MGTILLKNHITLPISLRRITAIACFWAANSETTVRRDLTGASDTNISNAYARSLIGVE